MAKSYAVTTAYLVVDWDALIRVDVAVGIAGRQDDIAAERVEAWRREAGSMFTLDWFDGGHFFIRQHEQRVVAAVVRELTHQFAGVCHAAAASA